MLAPRIPHLLYVFVLAICFILACRSILFFYSVLRRYLANWTARKQHGCRPPAHYPHTDMLGQDLYRERQCAIAEGRTVLHYDMTFMALGRTWEERFMGKRIINTINPQNIQHIFATYFNDFKKPGQKSSFKYLLGNGIFLSNGEKWKFSRNLIKPIFSRVEISDLTSIRKHANLLVQLLPRDGRSFDIQPLMKKLFLDISTDFIFGRSIDSLSHVGRQSAADDLLADLTCAIQGINDRISAYSRFQYYLDTKFPAAVDRIHKFIDAQVSEALAMTTTDTKLTEKTPSSGRFVLLHEMARQIRDPIQLRFEILNIFMASRDTISTLVSNCLFQLARHPEIWAELRTTSLLLGDDPDLSFEQLKCLHDFRHVINETFRTIGPTGKATRIAAKDTILPTGGGQSGDAPIFIPRGKFVVIPNNSLHHDRAIWGDDALEFRPSRWRETQVRQWEFIPFVGGPRMCPAHQMVMIQATYLLVLLTREFHSIENRDPVLEYIEEAQLLLTESRNGVLIGLLPASATHKPAMNKSHVD